MEIQVVSLGLTDYLAAWRLQQAVHACCQARGENVLLVTEHYPVVTLGYRQQAEHLRLSRRELEAKGIAVVESGRGGGATYHGPGQLVAYPIFSTLFRRRGVRTFISLLEDVMCGLGASYSIAATRRHGFPGVWVEERKLGAVGIAVRHGTSLHGIALNVSIDLTPFSYIIPCGIPDLVPTSIAQEVKCAVAINEAAQRMCDAFATVFAVPVEEANNEWRSGKRETLWRAVDHD
ncbi:MAG: lipoyl(octanoyl) transferase LipB [Deltaproteobacteria bacterium]|nr:lipoyl(octanoyl) transferase LipB [Deltaproteobacteria bacterium]